MAKFTKPLDLYKAQKNRFLRVRMSAVAAHAEIAERATTDAREITSGALTPKQTKGGYARGISPNSGKSGLQRRRLPKLPINVQRGDLRRGFRLRSVRKGLQTFDLGNPVKHARFVLSPSGTRVMVSRGFFEEIRKRWRARNKAFHDVYVKANRS